MVPSLPHTYYTRSCTINSLNKTSPTLKSYELETTAASDGGDSALHKLLCSFTLFNPGPGDEYRVRRMPVQDDGHWHDCVASSADPLPWQLVSCQYMLDRAVANKTAIGFRIQWYCDDRDPDHAYVLAGSGRLVDVIPNNIATFTKLAFSLVLAVSKITPTSFRVPDVRLLH